MGRGRGGCCVGPCDNTWCHCRSATPPASGACRRPCNGLPARSLSGWTLRRGCTPHALQAETNTISKHRRTCKTWLTRNVPLTPTAARRRELPQVQLFEREVDKRGEFAGSGAGVWETLQVWGGRRVKELITDTVNTSQSKNAAVTRQENSQQEYSDGKSVFVLLQPVKPTLISLFSVPVVATWGQHKRLKQHYVRFCCPFTHQASASALL